MGWVTTGTNYLAVIGSTGVLQTKGPNFGWASNLTLEQNVPNVSMQLYEFPSNVACTCLAIKCEAGDKFLVQHCKGTVYQALDLQQNLRIRPYAFTTDMSGANIEIEVPNFMDQIYSGELVAPEGAKYLFVNNYESGEPVLIIKGNLLHNVVANELANIIVKNEGWWLN